LLNGRNLVHKLDHISNVISHEPHLRVTWLINDSSIFMGMTFRYASALCCVVASDRYCHANSSDRPFISITLLECNSVYAPSISRRVNPIQTSRQHYIRTTLRTIITVISCEELNSNLVPVGINFQRDIVYLNWSKKKIKIFSSLFLFITLFSSMFLNMCDCSSREDFLI